MLIRAPVSDQGDWKEVAVLKGSRAPFGGGHASVNAGGAWDAASSFGLASGLQCSLSGTRL